MRTTVVSDQDPPSTADRGAGREVRRAVTALAARARAERPGDLTTTTVAVLGQLARSGGMRPGELAGRLGMLPQSLTRTLAAVEADGWVVRTVDPADGRQSLLTITERGQAVLQADMRPRDAWVAAAMAQTLTDAERDLLVLASRLMLRLADLDDVPVRTGS